MKLFLVGVRCNKWEEGCDCGEYQDNNRKLEFREKFHCMYDDACCYIQVDALDDESITLDMIKAKIKSDGYEDLVLTMKYTDYYIVGEVVKVSEIEEDLPN